MEKHYGIKRLKECCIDRLNRQGLPDKFVLVRVDGKKTWQDVHKCRKRFDWLIVHKLS